MQQWGVLLSFLTLAVTVSFVAPQSIFDFSRPLGIFSTFDICFAQVGPTKVEQEQLEYCLDQLGFREVVEDVKKGYTNWMDQYKTHAEVLDDAGYTKEAKKYRRCIFNQAKFLNPDGSASVAKILRDRVVPPVRTAPDSIAVNLRRGYEECPRSDLARFKIGEYVRCLMWYCVTGSYLEDK